MKFWKKLGGYMPILSTVLVVACVGTSLKGYAAPVYEVEQPETIQTEETTAKEKKQETEEKKQAKGSFDLADGIYKGSGIGFAGTVSVSVEIKDKSIVAINILSTQDDEAFFNRAKAVIDKIIESQSLTVDVVSGATYSSNGIISAVKNALTGEQDTSTPAASSSSSNEGSPSIETVDDSNQTWKDGTYYGSGTGFNGEVKVEVVISGGEISDISVVSHTDDTSFMSRAEGLISDIISTQSTNVDAVSGATYSSRGIINAVRAALKQAAVNPSDADTSADEDDKNNDDSHNGSSNTGIVEGKVPYKDGIYYGTGEGYAGDIELAVVIQDKTIKAVLITKCQDDDAFFNRAKNIINEVLKKQTTDLKGIDTVSGATYSSKGIIEALKEAFKEAKDVTEGKKKETETTKPTETETETETESESENPDSQYIDGEYTVSVVCEPDEDHDFEAYNLSMTVHIKNDRITAVTDLAGDGDASNESYIKRAAEGTSKLPGVISQITEKGIPEEIDTVTRATCSSNAIIEGCRKAFEAARRVTEPDETETEEPKNQTYADGEYTVSVVCEPDEDHDFEAYDLTMTVSVANDKITDISNISGNGSSDNDSYIKKAAEGTSKAVGVVTQITQKGMPEGIDTVTRATCSSNAIIEGCQKALEEARKLAEEGK